jgi:uncharacterized protein YndB with AHSA1/START domain
MPDSSNARATGHSEFRSVTAPGEVRIERLLPRPIERVWAYLTESDKRAKWLASGTMDPSVGSSLTLRFDHDSLSARKAPTPERFKQGECMQPTHHEVTRFEPPTVLAMTWQGGANGPSEVTFELSHVAIRCSPSSTAACSTATRW